MAGYASLIRPTSNTMNSAPLPLVAALAIACGLATAPSAAAPPKPKTITCPFLKNGHVTFDIPAKLSDLPAAIDFDYPAKAKEFSFRDGNLFLLAMDEEEPTRVRIMISAQRDKTTGAYAGQIFVDMGGHQLMLHNGPVRCVVGAGKVGQRRAA